MKENSIKDRVNILKIECYITENDKNEQLLNIGTTFSDAIKMEEFKHYKDELHKNIKPIINNLQQVVMNTLEWEDEQC